MPDDRDLLIALNACDRITRPALCRLALDLDAWRDLRPADVAPAARSLGVPAAPLRRALDARDEAPAVADDQQRLAERLNATIVTHLDAAYPTVLLDHPLPPPVLACRGAFRQAPAVAVVGARRADLYGRTTARALARRLAAAGVEVISGFALGVDREAHLGALEVPGGRTVAVVGCGLDVDYPRGGRVLADRIALSGAVVSEFAFGAEPRAWRFPIRNRVIAALADLTLVVQAKLRSGSLITAHQALDLGRDVFAVPGRIDDELSLGTNRLIADGAPPALCAEDLLERLDGLPLALVGRAVDDPDVASPDEPTPRRAEADEPTPTARPAGLAGQLLDRLDDARSTTVDALAADCDTSVDRVLAALLELEILGRVERLPGPAYLRREV
ncbi:MAG: DNA-processing protein DprA [Acidobacteriota bacterium]